MSKWMIAFLSPIILEAMQGSQSSITIAVGKLATDSMGCVEVAVVDPEAGVWGVLHFHTRD